MGFYTDSDKDKEYTQTSASKPNQNPFYSIIDQESLNDITKSASNKIQSIFNNDLVIDTIDQLKAFDFSNNSLRAYPVPSVGKYEKCINNNGISTWDENGWWRCLLPNSIARKNDLSKEDIENDLENKNGLYFKDYNQFLNWKVHLNKIIKENELIKQKENIQAIYDDYEKDYENDSKDVVRTSKSVYFKTLSNGDAQEITEIKNVYKDGTKHKETIKKIFPQDGSEPIVTKTEDNSNGWIWRRD